MFVKLFRSIFDGTLGADSEVRHIFMDLLALADRDGEVDMTPEAIARVTNVSLRRIKGALSTLAAPDPQSRNPSHDGRRIVLINVERGWGWRIVNYRVYRTIRDQRERREYFRDYKRCVREATSQASPPMSTTANPDPPESTT